MNIRYPIYEGVYRILTFQVSCTDWIVGIGLYQVIGISALSLTVSIR